MLTYTMTCDCSYPNMRVTLTVYANNKDDARKIAEAYLLTQGYKSVKVPTAYKFGGAAPEGAKVGVAPRPQKDDKDTALEYIQSLDFGELEERVLSYSGGHLGDLYADMASTAGVTRGVMKDAIWTHMYTPEHMGRPVHFVAAEANALPVESCDRRWVAVEGAPDEPRAPGTRSKFVEGKGWINLYPKSDGNVQAGNVYATKGEAASSAKYPGQAVQAMICWTVPGPRIQRDPQGWPLNFFCMEPGKIAHLQNRLRAWANLPDQNANIKVYANGQRGAGSVINITIGSPQWRACLDTLRAWLKEQGVEVGHRKGTTTVLELKWAELAPLVWPI